MIRTMKSVIILLMVAILWSSCSHQPAHPLYGKWKLAQVADSIVINNPDEITIEFLEDGRVITTGGPEAATEGKFMVSDDTTQISILEGGKVVDELKILQLTQQDMIIAEGKESVRFVKVE